MMKFYAKNHLKRRQRKNKNNDRKNMLPMHARHKVRRRQRKKLMQVEEK